MDTRGKSLVSEARCGGWPRIAFVTPVRNSAKFIEATIQSVLAQEYPNLDYFIVDGGSNDGTVEIIRKYENKISGWISEPDRGMYDAINKAFRRTTGEIMGWISATDILYPGGLRVVGSVFNDLPEIEWITGRPALINEQGMTVGVFETPHWSRFRFLLGANRFIMQEATFWRRSLWVKAGGYVDASSRLASDFELWVRFFRHAKLYPVEALIGAYRDHADALGRIELETCNRVRDEVIEAELDVVRYGKALRLLRNFDRRAKSIPAVRDVWHKLVTKPLYRRAGRDSPPTINYDQERWQIFV